jgi:hypothetical protein
MEDVVPLSEVPPGADSETQLVFVESVSDEVEDHRPVHFLLDLPPQVISDGLAFTMTQSRSWLRPLKYSARRCQPVWLLIWRESFSSVVFFDVG